MKTDAATNLVIENDYTSDYLPDGIYTGTLRECELWLNYDATLMAGAGCEQSVRDGFSHQVPMPDEFAGFAGWVTVTVAGDKMILNSK